MAKFRLWIQLLFTALSNGYLMGFAKGRLYTGPLKRFCLPGLNCYSCPGALGACPIGALQATIGSYKFNMAFYVAGTLIVFGALLGRAICGFLCPFGLVQDLLYRIPLPKRWKRKSLPGHRALVFLKYAILVGFVLVLPLLFVDIIGQGSPWFCKYICPSGTLFGGIPMVALNPPLQRTLGFLFTWKMAILMALLALSMFVYRPFCKYLCPLGAIYSFFNRVSLYRFAVDENLCVRCGACTRACRMDIVPEKTPNHRECIRCGDCMRACPHRAIHAVNAPRKRVRGKRPPAASF